MKPSKIPTNPDRNGSVSVTNSRCGKVWAQVFWVLAGLYSLNLARLAAPYITADPNSASKPFLLGTLNLAIFLIGSGFAGLPDPQKGKSAGQAILRAFCLFIGGIGVLAFFSPFRPPEFMRVQRSCLEQVEKVDRAWATYSSFPTEDLRPFSPSDAASGGRLVGDGLLFAPAKNFFPECVLAETASGGERRIVCRYHGGPGSPLPPPRTTEEAGFRQAVDMGFNLLGAVGTLFLPVLIFSGI